MRLLKVPYSSRCNCKVFDCLSARDRRFDVFWAGWRGCLPLERGLGEFMIAEQKVIELTARWISLVAKALFFTNT